MSGCVLFEFRVKYEHWRTSSDSTTFFLRWVQSELTLFSPLVLWTAWNAVQLVFISWHSSKKGQKALRLETHRSLCHTENAKNCSLSLSFFLNLMHALMYDTICMDESRPVSGNFPLMSKCIVQKPLIQNNVTLRGSTRIFLGFMFSFTSS